MNENRLPQKRWLRRGEVIEYLRGGRRELDRLVRTRVLVPEHPAGLKQARYVRAQVLAAIESH